ncbi:MAG TPA: hypothetical protein VN029_14060 [Sphingomonas sp.]|nr:hypothetical protein [Sphingomonas sp.]
MRFHLPAILLALVASGPRPAIAGERCNPPHQSCDGGDGIAYPCPPCRPDFDTANAPQLEAFRADLEQYRKQLEAERSADPGGSLAGYRKGIESYREGITEYRTASPDRGEKR